MVHLCTIYADVPKESYQKGTTVVRRSPLLVIFLTVFIDLLSVGIILPLLPYYVKIIEQADNPLLADHRALIVGALAAAFSLMQFLFAPMLGALSDRYGRRPVLLISLLGTTISYIMLGLAHGLIGFGVEIVLITLFCARILDGITGGNISISQAYIADTTTPENRARGMGMIGAAFGLGFMIGPALGGLLSTISLSMPAFVAASISFISVILGFFALPESLPPERRRRVPIIQMNPVSRLRGVLVNQRLRPLLIGMFLIYVAFAGLQSNFAVFTDSRFGFDALDNAMLFAFIGLIAVIVQGFLMRSLAPRFGEERLVLSGLMLMAATFGLIAVVPQAWMLYPVIGLLAAGSGMVTPSLTSLISQRVSPQEQGMTLGGTQALNSLSMITGPLLAGVVFDVVASTAPYTLGMVLIVAAIATLSLTFRVALPARQALDHASSGATLIME